MSYPIIYADPPWRYKKYAGNKGSRTAESYYPTMPTDEIAALPVGSLAAADCALFLWSTSALLPDALRVLGAWGFRYVTVAFAWVKLTKTGKLEFGMGGYTRGGAELVLLGVRGRMPVRVKNVRQVVMARLGEHSEKPEEVRQRIERLYPGPYLELFARRPAPGWDTWGNEIDSAPAVARVLSSNATPAPGRSPAWRLVKPEPAAATS